VVIEIKTYSNTGVDKECGSNETKSVIAILTRFGLLNVVYRRAYQKWLGIREANQEESWWSNAQDGPQQRVKTC
jgi:hypothetical protein